MIHTNKREKIKAMANENACLCFNIRKASRIVTQAYDEAFRPIGYTPSQVAILTAVKDLHSATVNELAEAVCTDRTTLSRNLKPLKKDGLIRPCNCADRREKAVMLTEKGNSVLEQAAPVWKSVHQKMNRLLGTEHMGRFLKELNTVTAKIQKG